MLICPVCENQQQAGDECAVCGKSLVAVAAPLIVATERVEGLEASRQEDVGAIAIERVAELEASRFESVNVAVEVTPDMQVNSQPAAGAVPIERLADVTEDRVPDDGVRSVLPAGPVTCRYCGASQASGLLCDRCGMRLPFRPNAAPAAAAAAKTGKAAWGVEEVRARCKACGALSTAGKRCKECGAEVPMPPPPV